MANNLLALPQFKFAQFDPTFRFDKGPHQYWLKGKELLGFSAILKAVRYVEEGYYTETARVRGSDVHTAIHFLNDGDLKWETVRGEIYGYVQAYEKLAKDWNIKLEFFEVPLYHPDLLYGVTPDVVCTVLDNVPAIFEIKTGSVLSWVRLQTAAQAMAVRAWEVKPVYRRRWGITLNANGTYNKPIEFKDPMDEVVFKALVTTAQARPNYAIGG